MLKKIAVAALALSAIPAFAQEAPTPPKNVETTEAVEKKWSVTIDPYAGYEFEADLHRSDASMSVARAGALGNVRLDLTPDWSVNLGIDTEYSHYRFSNTAGILPVDRLRLDLYSVTLTPGVTYKLSDQWSVSAGVIVDFSGEEDADFSQTGTYGGYVAAGYKVSDRLFLSFGLAAKSRLEDDFFVAPTIGVRWKINDSLSLSTSTTGLGYTARLTQALDKQWSVSLLAAYQMREYRLNDSGSLSDAVLRDSSLPVGAELAWSPVESITLRGTAGFEVYQRVEFDDRDGNDLSDRVANPAPFVMLSAAIKF